MSLKDLAQEASSAFSKIVTAENDLDNAQHGVVARTALAKSYAFGLAAQTVPTEYKAICVERGFAEDAFSWLTTIRCVYGEFVSVGDQSNKTVWAVSKSNQVISKYHRVLSYGAKMGWNEAVLKTQLEKVGIEGLVKEARKHDKEDGNGDAKSEPVFTATEAARLDAQHAIDITAFDLTDEIFQDGYASVLLRKTDSGYKVWAAPAEPSAIRKVASPFIQAKGTRATLLTIASMIAFTTDTTIYVHNQTNQSEVVGFGKVSFQATGPHIAELPTGFFAFGKEDIAALKKLVKHFGDVIFEWEPKDYKGNPIIAISGPYDINKLVAAIKDKKWKPSTTAKFVYLPLTERKPLFADGTERKAHVIGGVAVPLNAQCLVAMKAVDKKAPVKISVKGGKISLIQGKGKPRSAAHDGDPVELEAEVLKGLLPKAISVLPTDDVKLFLEGDTAQFEFDYDDGFVVRVNV